MLRRMISVLWRMSVVGMVVITVFVVILWVGMLALEFATTV